MSNVEDNTRNAAIWLFTGASLTAITYHMGIIPTAVMGGACAVMAYWYGLPRNVAPVEEVVQVDYQTRDYNATAWVTTAQADYLLPAAIIPGARRAAFHVTYMRGSLAHRYLYQWMTQPEVTHFKDDLERYGLIEPRNRERKQAGLVLTDRGREFMKSLAREYVYSGSPLTREEWHAVSVELRKRKHNKTGYTG